MRKGNAAQASTQSTSPWRRLFPHRKAGHAKFSDFTSALNHPMPRQARLKLSTRIQGAEPPRKVRVSPMRKGDAMRLPQSRFSMATALPALKGRPHEKRKPPYRRIRPPYAATDAPETDRRTQRAELPRELR